MTYVPDPDNLTDVDKYWVGYFRADGSLSGQRAQFVQADKHVVEEFCRYLGLPVSRCYEHKSTAVSGGKLFTHYRMGYTALYGVYHKLGVKTTLRDQGLYQSYDFWRGLIDGDGSVNLRKDTAVVVRLCGRLDDCLAFAELCRSLLSFSPSITPTKSIYSTGVTGNKARYLLKLIYSQGYSANQAKSEKARLIYNQPYTTGKSRTYDLVQEILHEAPTCREM